MLPPELTRPAPKAPGSFDRCVPLEQTLALIPQLRERYGITRIADITHLDRIGIPVVSAVIPDSPDVISIYNGKGATYEAALAGAVMEAVERQAATAPSPPVFERDARAVVAAFQPDGYEIPAAGKRIAAVEGIDLLSGGALDVPLAWVRFPWPGECLIFPDSTNGLAAGNTSLEAVYHALCELLERHLWAIAHAQGYLRPRAIIEGFTGPLRSSPVFTDDAAAFEIELPTGLASVDALAERITLAGLALRVRAVDRPPFPLLLLATIADNAGGPSAAHTGHGCSWSPEHAAIRAITEAAQSRAVDFMGAREDVWLHDQEPLPRYGTRRTFGVPNGRWHYNAPAERRALRSFADRSTHDLAGDVALLLTALRDVGSGPVALVDLSPSGLPVHVVRAIAPNLEKSKAGAPPGPAVRAILAS